MLQLGQEDTSPHKSNVADTTFSSFSESDGEASPLMRASRATGHGQSPGSTYMSCTSDSRDEAIPSEIHTGGHVLKQKHCQNRGRKRPSVTASSKQVVLKELGSGENEFSMDYKYILLEDLGTASSWVILLLPYVAFIICLLLESFRDLKVVTMGPLSASLLCNNSMLTTMTPIETPIAPCYSPFSFKSDEDRSAIEHNDSVCGTAFDSGIIRSVPLISTFLYGDAEFQELSTETVALVARGLVEASVAVQQRVGGHWHLMYLSSPKTVSMACERHDYSLEFSKQSVWDCKSPRIIDVVFSLPEVSVYAGGDVRVNVLYSLKSGDGNSMTVNITETGDPQYSYVYTKSYRASMIFSSVQIKQPSLRVSEIVSSSAYLLEYMSPLAMQVDTIVRLSTFLISLVFVIFWCYSMGVTGCLCCLDACFPGQKRGKRGGEIMFAFNFNL